MTDRWVSGGGQRWLGHVSLVMAVAVAFLASAVGGGRASAAPATVGGGCGFRLGVPFETGALGSFGLEVPVYPADPHQVCRVTVRVQASLRPVGGAATPTWQAIPPS